MQAVVHPVGTSLGVLNPSEPARQPGIAYSDTVTSDEDSIRFIRQERIERPNEIEAHRRFLDAHAFYVDSIGVKTASLLRGSNGHRVHVKSPAGNAATTRCWDAHGPAIVEHGVQRKRGADNLQAEFARMAN